MQHVITRPMFLANLLVWQRKVECMHSCLLYHSMSCTYHYQPFHAHTHRSFTAFVPIRQLPTFMALHKHPVNLEDMGVVDCVLVPQSEKEVGNFFPDYPIGRLHIFYILIFF